MVALAVFFRAASSPAVHSVTPSVPSDADIFNNSESSTDVKQSKHISVSTVIFRAASLAEDEAIMFGRMPVILFLLESILFQEDPMRSLLLRAGRTDGSAEL